MKLFVIIITILLAFSQPLAAETDPEIPAMTEEQIHQAVLDALSDQPERIAPDEQIITPELEARVRQIILESAETYYDNRFDSLQVSLGVYVTIFLAMVAFFGLVIGVFVPFFIENKRDKKFAKITKEIEKQKTELQEQLVKKIAKADVNIKKHLAAPLGRVFSGLAQAFHETRNSHATIVCALDAVYQSLILERHKRAEDLLSLVLKEVKHLPVTKEPEGYWSVVKGATNEIKSIFDLKDHPEINEMVKEISRLAASKLEPPGKKST